MNDSHLHQFDRRSPENQFSADPFVDPSLAQQPATGLPHDMERIKNNLQALEQLQNDLNDCESAGPALRQTQPQPIKPAPGIQPRAAKPQVEVIGADPQQPAPTTSDETVAAEPAESTGHRPREIELNFSVTCSSQAEDADVVSKLDTSQLDKVSLSSIEFDGNDIHEFDLALNILPQRNKIEDAAGLPHAARPPLNLDPISDEIVFDVRDFSDTTASPNPIAGAFEVDPDTFDHFTADQLRDSPDDWGTMIQRESTAPPESDFATDPAGQKEVFLAEHNQVITLDGKDGFDLIDLTCFDSSLASIEPGRIRIEDRETGTRFEIHYRNIPLVCFANEEVELS